MEMKSGISYIAGSIYTANASQSDSYLQVFYAGFDEHGVPKWYTASDGTSYNAGLITTAADSIRIMASQSPASNGTGVQGEIAWDASYIYVCTATNTWKRAALTGGY
jgi:hypothetical protein